MSLPSSDTRHTTHSRLLICRDPGRYADVRVLSCGFRGTANLPHPSHSHENVRHANLHARSRTTGIPIRVAATSSGTPRSLVVPRPRCCRDATTLVVSQRPRRTNWFRAARCGTTGTFEVTGDWLGVL